MADRAVGELARSLDLSHDALVVVSDHGMAPVWETVHVNQLLQHAGLAQAEEGERGWRVKSSSRIVAFGSSGCANLYVNLKGREPSGVVEPDEREAVIRAAAAALANAQVDGTDVVEAMYRREDLGPLGLDNPNAGDLVVFMYPGFTATSEIGAPGSPFHAPAGVAGQHGFLNTHPEMAAVWLARGAVGPGSSRRKRSAHRGRGVRRRSRRRAAPSPGATLESVTSRGWLPGPAPLASAPPRSASVPGPHGGARRTTSSRRSPA